MLLKAPAGAQAAWLAVTASPMPGDGDLVLVVLEDVTEPVQLRQILPICSHCHRARDDEDNWQTVKAYLNKHG